MFRAADVGLMWVPVALPVSDGDDDPVIWLHQRLFTRAELAEREKDTLRRTAQKQEATLAQSREVADVLALMDTVEQLEQADLAELRSRTVDWRDVAGDDGAPMAFDAERFDALLAHQWFARAVRAALFKASREGVAKNSLPGSAGTPARAQA